MRDKNRKRVHNSHKNRKKDLTEDRYSAIASVLLVSLHLQRVKRSNTVISISVEYTFIVQIYKNTKRFIREGAEQDHYIDFEPCSMETPS